MKLAMVKLFVFVFVLTIIGALPLIEGAKQLQPIDDNLPIASMPSQVAGQDEEAVPEVPGKLVLRAQKTCEIGELVRFDATESDVDGIVWQIRPHTKDFEVIENGRRAFFSSRVPGEYLIVVAAAKDGHPHLTYHSIQVEGEVQPPGPASLDTKIAEWYAGVKSENKKAEALAVVGVFRTLSTTDIEVAKILEATALANKKALGASLENWVPFLDGLGTELDVYIEQKQLGTREQYKDVWSRIADGLEKAANQPADDEPAK